MSAVQTFPEPVEPVTVSGNDTDPDLIPRLLSLSHAPALLVTGSGSLPDFGERMACLRGWLERKPARQVFGVTVRTAPDAAEPDDARVSRWVAAGLRLVVWDCPPGLPRLPETLLWQMARQGVWHHLTGPGAHSPLPAVARFVAANPAVVPSMVEPRGGTAIPRPYDDMGGLPGKPAGESFRDPGQILSLLLQHPAPELMRMRWDGEGGIIRLGQDIRYEFRPPRDLPPGYLDVICAMVAAAGSVDMTHVRANLENAHLIGYAQEYGILVGNSSLKHPRAEFIRRLKQQTGLDFTGYVERGYTSVRPEYRSLGVGRKLLEGLTSRAEPYPVFSLIDEDNHATRTIAQRNNTRKIHTYLSEKTGKSMGVWIPAGQAVPPAMPAESCL